MVEAESASKPETYLERRARITSKLANLDGDPVEFTPISNNPVLAKAEGDAYKSNMDKLTIEGIILGLLVDDVSSGDNMMDSFLRLTGGDLSEEQISAISAVDFSAPAEQWTLEQTQAVDDIVGKIVNKTLDPSRRRGTPA